MAETARPDVAGDLNALAREAGAIACHERKIKRHYYLARNLLWLLAAALAGLAGVLALGGASKTATAVAAFTSAFSTAFEARFTPAERNMVHLQRGADYENIACRALLAAKHAKDDDERLQQLRQLHDEKYRLDRYDEGHRLHKDSERSNPG